MRVIFEAAAHGDDERVERLHETPKRDNQGKDTAFTNRYLLAFVLARQGCYDRYQRERP